ncbi:unnamed protein product [Adineta steineri]|uniref:Uncharacterized protein n=1 Tax=Adineta steineri TaxID=433720 RepID=A0A814FKY3_9BILA|nr:unnamed protein product [Adineta steineri]CAF3512775.1 unnamed protein product [Adineta steineri]
MVLFPKSGFGRFLLGVIVIGTISYMTLNLVSFAGTPWITYSDVPIHFGLWRVCDISAPGLCNQWSDKNYSSNNTRVTFGSKPGFITSVQPLEIISLIFYVIAAVLIILGILNLDGMPYYIMFIAAAILLFICITFLSATLGVMSVQGRRGHILARLDWAWWNGLVGLIMTIITFLALIILVLDMRYSAVNKGASKNQRSGKQQNLWSGPIPSAYPMSGGGSPQVLGINAIVNQPYNYAPYHAPAPPQYHPQENYSQYQHPSSPPPQHNYQPQYSQSDQHHYNNYDPMAAYGGQSPAEQYFNTQQAAPIISALARQYVFDIHDAQYRDELLNPYRQYAHDPYIINNYL